MSFQPAEQAPTTTVGALPPATSDPGDARDLRQLLAVVLDALTLLHDTPDYDRRILDRAMWARTAIKGALEEDPADIGWNADYLRGKLRANTEAADKTSRAFPVADESTAETATAEELISGTQRCGHDDYHDGHPWADQPGMWCPGIADERAGRGEVR